jgi:SAM-dependent methyltransferase
LPTGRSIRKRKRPKRLEGRPSPGFSVLTLRPSSFVGGLFRRFRWRASRWSASADREFHDTLFSSHQYDPFSFAYPGYLTIRRFAALASERLRIIGATRVADLGCGPGEITCELARTHPEIAFVGIDHSAAAIARAREHAARLGLANVTFRQEDVSRSAPDADIILMFDAFHHLLDPSAFVRASGVDRFLLVEPAGTWFGGWQRTLELDWIASALDDIRARLLWEAGEPTPAAATSSAASPEISGEAVEHRYPIEEFKRFFAGFGLDVRGTAAGFDRYPPDPHGRAPLREAFGRATYDALVAVEDALYARDLDLHAKHWVIYAERGAPDRLRTPAPLRRTGDPPRLQGSHDVEFAALDAPADAAANTTLACTLTLRNRSWRTLSSADGIFASYHWLDATGAVVVQDGARSPLPRAVEPGGECTMTLRVDTPAAPGRYTLAVDLVEEGVTWFSAAGAPMLRRPVRVS